MNTQSAYRALDATLLRKNVDTVITASVDEARIVGGVVSILQDGRPLYTRAAGLFDREDGTPMREDAIFRLASVTKPIATIAALRLVEAEALSLEASITDYLPSFRPKLPDGSEPTITVNQLLTHTGGLSYSHQQPANGPYVANQVTDGFGATGVSFEEEFRRVVAAGLSYPPGTQWGYSIGLDVLGAAIERVTAKSLPATIDELVTGPLGMTDTLFTPRPGTELATPYADGTPPVRMQEGEIVPFMELSGLRFSVARAFDPKSYPSAGAGMIGTMRDVVRVLELVRSGGGALLSETTARAMWTNQTGNLPIAFGPGWGFGYGGAVLIDPAAAHSPQSAGTWSWGGVWGHSWFVDPVLRLVVVGLTNTAIEGMIGRFPFAVRNAVYASLTA
jgi:CubicO group peptidase (beta-lactamase class C family)